MDASVRARCSCHKACAMRVLRFQRVGQRGCRAMANTRPTIKPTQRIFPRRPTKPDRRNDRGEREEDKSGKRNDANSERGCNPQAGPRRRKEEPHNSQQPCKMRPATLPCERHPRPLQRLRKLKLPLSLGIACTL